MMPSPTAGQLLDRIQRALTDLRAIIGNPPSDMLIEGDYWEDTTSLFAQIVVTGNPFGGAPRPVFSGSIFDHGRTDEVNALIGRAIEMAIKVAFGLRRDYNVPPLARWEAAVMAFGVIKRSSDTTVMDRA